MGPMINNKELQLEMFGRDEGVPGGYRMHEADITRWCENIGRLRSELSELDTEVNAYERGIEVGEGKGAGV